MTKLTLKRVREASKRGQYCDGNGLYLQVAKGGSKSWILRATIAGRRHNIGLGGFPTIPLTLARKRALEMRAYIAQGGDPLADRRKARKRAQVPTFREAALKTIEAECGAWKGGADGLTARHWISSLERRAFVSFGDLPVDSIRREDVLEVLSPIWTAKPVEARKLRQRIRTTFNWARAMRFCDRNPAGDVLTPLLPKRTNARTHLRALPYAEVPEALEIIAASRASWAAKLCLRLVVLTATRSGEARLATWDEVEVEDRTWTIPGARMKAGKEHRIPLSDAALAVLEEARVLDDGSGLIFPSPRRPGCELSNMTLTKVLRDCGLADRGTVHGFRSGFRTWAEEKTGADHAVMELCLAHQVGSAVERAYARSDLFRKRAVLMDSWAQFLTGGIADVVELHRHA